MSAIRYLYLFVIVVAIIVNYILRRKGSHTHTYTRTQTHPHRHTSTYKLKKKKKKEEENRIIKLSTRIPYYLKSWIQLGFSYASHSISFDIIKNNAFRHRNLAGIWLYARKPHTHTHDKHAHESLRLKSLFRNYDDNRASKQNSTLPFAAYRYWYWYICRCVYDQNASRDGLYWPPERDNILLFAIEYVLLRLFFFPLPFCCRLSSR